MSMSQGAFAEMLGVSRTSITNWENEDRNGFSRKNAETIAKMTGASLQWLLHGTGKPPAMVNVGWSEREKADTSRKGKPRNRGRLGKRHTLRDLEEAIVAGIDQTFLLIVNRAPTQDEKATLVGLSKALFQERQARHSFQSATTPGQIRSSVPSRTDGKASGL